LSNTGIGDTQTASFTKPQDEEQKGVESGDLDGHKGLGL
jgi:hypothetical protein